MISRVGVVVPVHDEEDHLETCLDALEAACARLPERARAHVVVVLDACTDGSESIGQAAAERGLFDILTVGYRNVGRARAAGLDRALVLCGDVAPESVWLASTDADSLVPSSWLLDQLALASTGADAIAGTVRVHDWQDYPGEGLLRFQEFYDAFGGTEHHDHVHGANLGVRADAYRDAGGFAALATGEDHAIVRALRNVGRSVVSTRRIEVTTSARRAGRAPLGFAGFLEAFARPADA
ncbi:MAG: glycosyltransferase [Polyangiaceae bacterium]